MLFKGYLAVCCKHSCSIDKPARLHSASLHSYLIDSFCLASSGIQIFQRSILTQFFINEDVISGLSSITATVSTYKHSMPYLLSDNCVQCIFPDLRAILDWWAMPEMVCSTLSMFWGKRYPSQSDGPDFFIQRNIFLLGKKMSSSREFPLVFHFKVTSADFHLFPFVVWPFFPWPSLLLIELFWSTRISDSFF